LKVLSFIAAFSVLTAAVSGISLFPAKVLRQTLQGAWVHAATDIFSVALGNDQPGFSEYLEMLRYRRLRDGDRTTDLAHRDAVRGADLTTGLVDHNRAAAGAQKLKYTSSRRVTERMKQGIKIIVWRVRHGKTYPLYRNSFRHLTIRLITK
jgi:hypothetical protein